MRHRTRPTIPTTGDAAGAYRVLMDDRRRRVRTLATALLGAVIAALVACGAPAPVPSPSASGVSVASMFPEEPSRRLRPPLPAPSPASTMGEPLGAAGTVVVLGNDGSLSLVEATGRSIPLASTVEGSFAVPGLVARRIADRRDPQRPTGNAILVFDVTGPGAGSGGHLRERGHRSVLPVVDARRRARVVPRHRAGGRSAARRAGRRQRPARRERPGRHDRHRQPVLLRLDRRRAPAGPRRIGAGRTRSARSASTAHRNLAPASARRATSVRPSSARMARSISYVAGTRRRHGGGGARRTRRLGRAARCRSSATAAGVRPDRRHVASIGPSRAGRTPFTIPSGPCACWTRTRRRAHAPRRLGPELLVVTRRRDDRGPAASSRSGPRRSQRAPPHPVRRLPREVRFLFVDVASGEVLAVDGGRARASCSSTSC